MESGCLDEGTVVAFLDGGLAPPERSAIERHLEACSSCTELLTWAAADQAHGSRSAGREGRPFIGRLEPGSRVDRYQILGAVGRGGMGEVYAAYHPDLDRRIALKVVGESGGNSAERRARLLREARAIARLSHPNVVSVHDAGTVGDRVYIAMEFVEGETVDEWLRSKPRGWREILDVFIAAGRGLVAAHAAGVIHRDFKPQNVMIGRDGSVRVMDFGLARLAEEPVDIAEPTTDAGRQPPPSTVTRTGALVGTLAYMAPEQFRGEKLDARADQFSFCVALHEATFGSRPALQHLQVTERAPEAEASEPIRSSSAPSWLRGAILRGLSPDRNRRFTSMEGLLASVTRGQARVRRRGSALAVCIAAVLLSLGGWRLASARRVSCAVPKDRLAGAWLPGDESDPRHQAVHRAFAASGRPTAETSWQRVSTILDDYVRQWSAMYVQACEATNVRGEQSGEVLDLRMSCLNDNIDQVRALTNVLASADSTTIGGAVVAAHDLAPLSRCVDLALLRSAVPLPKDRATLEAVQALRGSLREAQAQRDAANFHAAGERAIVLLPRVEATGYGPLKAELLELIACTGMDDSNTPTEEIEERLHRALFAAEAAHDDVTAAKAATDLVYYVGVFLERPREAEMWFRLAESILDRLGPGQERIRAWNLNNLASVLNMTGDLDRATGLARQALALKERVLGKDHPDVAITLHGLSSILEENGQAREALQCADRALDILGKNGDPASDSFASGLKLRGEVLVTLGRGIEAEAAFVAALPNYRRRAGASNRITSYPLQGIGDAKLVQGNAAEAVPILEEALRIREEHEPFVYSVAQTRFSLARALWESGGDRKRALTLARKAERTFSSNRFPRRERAVIQWLAQHGGTPPAPSVPPRRL